jgi:hypothetical protein
MSKINQAKPPTKYESNQLATLSFSQLIILRADTAYDDGTDRAFRNVGI